MPKWRPYGTCKEITHGIPCEVSDMEDRKKFQLELKLKFPFDMFELNLKQIKIWEILKENPGKL